MVVEIDVAQREVRRAIAVGSTNAHRLEVLPDGSELYTENEEDPFATVVDLRVGREVRRIPAPNGLARLGLSPDGRTLVMVDAGRPELIVVDTATDEVVRTVRLAGHNEAAQIARFSPDGAHLVAVEKQRPSAARTRASAPTLRGKNLDGSVAPNSTTFKGAGAVGGQKTPSLLPRSAAGGAAAAMDRTRLFAPARRRA